MVELDWSPLGLAQAEDRIHRIGQKGEVEITYLVAPDTIDERMLEILNNKKLVVAKTTKTGEFGHKKDGTARLQKPGPGRPRIPEEQRKANARKAKKGWAEVHKEETREYTKEYMKEYMREYMRKRRAAAKQEMLKETKN